MANMVLVFSQLGNSGNSVNIVILTEILASNYHSNRKMLKFDKEITKAALM